MQQNKVSNTTQLELTTQTVFGLNLDDNSRLCLRNKPRYKSNDKVTVTQLVFFDRMRNKFGDLFDTFDWSNTIIAGGLISGLIESKYDPTEYRNSDIDLFVYGNSNEIVREKIQYIYDYFVTKLDKNFYAFVYAPNACMVDIVIPKKYTIQIIGTMFKSSMDVLKSFDLTHCQIGYDGLNIIYTKEFIEAVTTRITKITKRSIHAYRLVKAYNRGYSIKDPEYCYIKNIFHEYISKPGDKVPSNSDKYYDIHDLDNIIFQLSRNNIIVYKNLNKNYIPKFDPESKEVASSTMKIIGEHHAGVDKYIPVNDFNLNIFISDIREYLIFVRLPFLC